MKIDLKLLECQIDTLSDQLNKELTKQEREDIEGLLNLLGDIAEEGKSGFSVSILIENFI